MGNPDFEAWAYEHRKIADSIYDLPGVRSRSRRRPRGVVKALGAALLAALSIAWFGSQSWGGHGSTQQPIGRHIDYLLSPTVPDYARALSVHAIYGRSRADLELLILCEKTHSGEVSEAASQALERIEEVLRERHR